ncbi:MAG: hypothetical protein ACFE8N_01380, partial [Promethearchaeota archaeon]
MIKNIKKGNTLIVKGPARITVLEGKIDVFGKIIIPEEGAGTKNISSVEDQNVIIIPSAQSYPLYAQEQSKLEIYTSNSENLKVIEENTIS